MGADDGEASIEDAWAGEYALLSRDVRDSVSLIDVFLAERFHEIGQSGRHWTREETLEVLPEEDPEMAKPVLDEKRADRLSSDLILLTYRLEFNGRGSRRSSIWRVCDGQARLEFHQGTPLT